MGTALGIGALFLTVARKMPLPVVFAMVNLTAVAPARGEVPNHAAAFGWQGYADTDLRFSEFYGADHTLMMRFMVQYPTAYTGPILSVNGSGQFLVMKRNGEPRLEVILGGHEATLDLPNPLRAGVWYHLAIVRSADSFTFYLDGEEICGACNVTAGPTPPSGTLRLARLANGLLAGREDAQFYGFIDDTAVFGRALATSQIATIAAAPRLTGSEPDLYAGYTFDSLTPAGDELPEALSRPVSFQTHTLGPVIPGKPAYVSVVSQLRDSALDAERLPPPFQQTPMHLPFPVGEPWVVTQGWEGAISHNGVAAFAWDFILAGQPLSATLVVETRNDTDFCGSIYAGSANYVMVEHEPREIGTYLHFVEGSVSVANGRAVAAGDYLADAGDTGNSYCGFYHLHYALADLPESYAGALVTFPGAFTNYEVSTDSGTTWQFVRRGVPRLGEWVRAAPDHLPEVGVDIHPGTEANTITAKPQWPILVALLGSDVLDVTEVNADSLAFGPEGATYVHDWVGRVDVSADGVDDLLTQYSFGDTGLPLGEGPACLTGRLDDGTFFEGCDTVNVVMPTCGLGFELALLLPMVMGLRGRRRRAAA
jgi:hypothetical protein